MRTAQPTRASAPATESPPNASARAGVVALAIGIWVFCLLAATCAILLLVLNRRAGTWDDGFRPIELTIAYALPSVGVIIATRRPRNALGWLLLLPGISQSLSIVTLEYARYALFTRHGSLPLGDFSAWVEQWVWCVGEGVFCAAPLLFPTGRPPTRRWNWVLWLIVACVLVYVISAGIDYWGQSGRVLVGPGGENYGDPDIIPGIAFLVMNAAALVSLASLVVRYRRGTFQERLQIRWLIYAMALAIVVALVVNFDLPVGPVIYGLLWYVASPLSILGIALAVMIAILRYRLYEIDLIINRTLVYGSLTALLAGLYFGSVVLLQTLSRAVTGQKQESALAIVISTLLIAALFQPLRVRLQQMIDRRFYRQKYDAAKTLARFADTLRGEVELTDLEQHLLGVVEETMRPAHVSLWLRAMNEEGK